MDKRHFSPNKADREMKLYFHPLYKMNSYSRKEWDRVESLLDEISADVVNGITTSEIIIRLEQGGHYENQNKPIKHSTALEYIEAVKSRMSLDRNRDVEQVKDSLYAQYINIYREAMESGNLMMAKSTLDSLVKLYGIDKAPATAVQINTNKDSVNINFGLDNNE